MFIIVGFIILTAIIVIYIFFPSFPPSLQSDDSSRSPTPCSERGRSTGGESLSVGGEGRSVGSERGSAVKGGIGSGARKRDKVLVSDDSEESTLDSSDNDFEEQIKKMKVRAFSCTHACKAGHILSTSHFCKPCNSCNICLVM